MTATAGSPSSTYKYPGPNSTNPTYTVIYTQMPIHTNFQCSGITDYTSSPSPYLVTEIDLPDIGTNPNDKYTFSYEKQTELGYTSWYTGRLASVTLPSGGTITYAYSGGSNNTGMICADGTTAMLTRTTMDGTWTTRAPKTAAPPGLRPSLTPPPRLTRRPSVCCRPQ